MGSMRPVYAGAAAAVIVAGLAAVAWVVFSRSDESFGVSTPPSRDEGVYRLATYNVGGLFDASDDPRLRGDDDDVPTPEERLAAIAGAIRAIDADILALQDVESRDAVVWFRDKYLGDMGYGHIASLDVGHARGAENAVLSRFEIAEEKVWPDLKLGESHQSTIEGEANALGGKPIRFRRSPLMVRVEVPGAGSRGSESLWLFNVELKGGDRYEYWRQAEAQALLRLVQDVGPGRRVVLLGSFHAEPGAPSIETLLGAGFMDILGAEGEKKRWVTEASGDRTDLILANRNALADLDPEAGFVLGGAHEALSAGAPGEEQHLPVVVGLPQ